ncbi:hypothetical protein EH228_10575 [Erwinia endophytica]|uniref:hypothetical protein n=1 Tax=Erwinia endophytica TaxID=1563158 RepID=UPI001265E0E8|nr:hypothetical protein [Erwinia endophytica]KAB8310549.1 hypothetical protein EH228_10575 [Erwinia endophytica]
MSNFLSPLPSYSLDRAAQMLCAHGASCTSEDLLTLWKEAYIELCFYLPDYIACENVPAPGTGRQVLLSVTPTSFHVFWESVDYDFPPNDYAMLYVKEYGSTDSYTERKLYVSISPDYSVYDDHGQRLSAVLSLTYGLDGLSIPGKELEKVFRFLTQPNSGDPSAEYKPVSAKTINYLATALKAFIHIHYGADVAENLRKYLEDPTSEIRKDFADKEIKAPGGKALAGHLKDILIEVLPSIEKTDVESGSDNE